MKVYKVELRGKYPVAVITENKRITIAHPSLGDVIGKRIEKVEDLVKKKKGSITRVYPSTIKNKTEVHRGSRTKSKS